MSAQRGDDVPLVVVRFSEGAVKQLHRFGIEVTQFFTPYAQMLQSVYSSMSAIYQTLLSAVSVSDISIVHVAVPSAVAAGARSSGRYRRHVVRPKRAVGTAMSLPIVFHFTVASKAARDLSLRVAANAPAMAAQEDIQEAPQASPIGVAQPEIAPEEARGPTGKIPQFKVLQQPVQRREGIREPKTAAAFRTPIVAMMAAAAPFSFLGLGGNAYSVLSEAASLPGMALGVQGSSPAAYQPFAARAAGKGSAPTAREMAAVKQRVELGGTGSGVQGEQFNVTITTPPAQQVGGATGALQDNGKAAQSPRQALPATAASDFARTAVAVGMASGLVGAAAMQRSVAEMVGGAFWRVLSKAGTWVGGAAAGGQGLQPLSGAAMPIHGDLPALPYSVGPMQPIGAIGPVSRASDARLGKAGGVAGIQPLRTQLVAGAESVVFRVMVGLLTEYPSVSMMRMSQASFGAMLAGLGAPPVGRSAPDRAERGGAEASEELTIESMPRYMRLEEPTVAGGSASVNINVVAEGEDDLKDLERKISKILEGQMRRHYGQG